MTAVVEDVEVRSQVDASRPSFVQRLVDGNFLALFDQAVVSGTSFLTTVLIGRLCGKDELGLYSLGFSIVLFILTVQQALVQVPYTVYFRRTPESEQREYAGSVLLHWLVLACLSVIGLLIGQRLIEWGYGPAALAPVLSVLVAAAPFILLRDFARGYAFARLRVPVALVLDITVSALQIGGIALLAWRGALSASAFFVVAGVSGLIGTGFWLRARRHEFQPRWPAARRTWNQSWRFGRWVFAGGIVSNLNSDAFLIWLLALVCGKASAGIFAACMTVVFFSNPFILGVNQILMPRTAHALADGGIRELRRIVYSASLILSVVMGGFAIAVTLWGDDIMQLIYGSEFTGHRATLMAVAAAVLVSAVGLGPSKGLWTLELPQLDVIACSIGFLVTAIGASVLVSEWGEFGVACGWLAGNLAMTVARFAYFEQRATLIARSTDELLAKSPFALEGVIDP